MTVSLSLSAASAIYDYATLISAAADSLDRTDLTAKYPRYIQLTEAYLRRQLRTLDMETTVILTVSTEDSPLPADMLSMRALHIEGTTDTPLIGMSPSAMALEFSGATAQTPTAYARIGNTLRLAPPPATAVNLELLYIAKFTPLSATTVSNWLLADYPDIYFYGVLAQACADIADSAGVQTYGQLFADSVNALKDARARDRWGSGPLAANGVIQIRGARC